MKTSLIFLTLISLFSCIKQKECHKNKVTEIIECKHDRCHVKLDNGSMALLKTPKVGDEIEMCQEK